MVVISLPDIELAVPSFPLVPPLGTEPPPPIVIVYVVPALNSKLVSLLPPPPDVSVE
jgi:hypothetical protein